MVRSQAAVDDGDGGIYSAGSSDFWMGFQVNICGKKLDEKGVKALLCGMAVVTVGAVLLALSGGGDGGGSGGGSGALAAPGGAPGTGSYVIDIFFELRPTANGANVDGANVHDAFATGTHPAAPAALAGARGRRSASAAPRSARERKG